MKFTTTDRTCNFGDLKRPLENVLEQRFDRNSSGGKKCPIQKESHVLVIYTGGTIGMKKSNEGYTVVPDYFAKAMKRLPMLHDEDFNSELCQNNLPRFNYPQLVMPISKMGTRVFYYLKEYDPILDSSNMSMSHWSLIANDIKEHYNDFDSFVVLHGTDTMAYTASALSYMLENLDKTVVVTGSQIPIFEQRSDGRSNLIGALEIAGHFKIPEVTLFFNNKLFRGNRCQKISASDIDAFDSPNAPPLAKLGTEIDVDWDLVIPNTTTLPLKVSDEMSEKIGLLRLFPGISTEIVRAYLNAPIDGIVIESFGTGNIPSNRPDLVQEFRLAAKRNVLIMNITQCYKGSVSDAYAAGRVMYDIGVVPGYDMTPEAALTKMAYVLGKKGLSHKHRKTLMQSSLRGEISVPQTERQYSPADGQFVKSVAESLGVGSPKEMSLIRKALHPILLTSAVRACEKHTIQQLIEQGADLNGTSEHNGKTCLHLACIEGHYDIVEQLIRHGASVSVLDRNGMTPLLYAMREKHYDVICLLMDSGASLTSEEFEIAQKAFFVDSDFHTDVKHSDVKERLHNDGKADLQLVLLKRNDPIRPKLQPNNMLSIENMHLAGVLAKNLHVSENTHSLPVKSTPSSENYKLVPVQNEPRISLVAGIKSLPLLQMNLLRERLFNTISVYDAGQEIENNLINCKIKNSIAVE